MISLNLDLGQALELRDNLEPKVRKALEEAARDLQTQSHAHIVEEVQKNLHSTREKYLGALKFDQVDPGTWVITLDRSQIWIEEGMEEHSMLDDLLGSPKARVQKDGSRYVIVPFQHNKGPTQQTQAAQDLTSTLKRELASRKIPYQKTETHPDGSPKLGLLHKFDVMSMPKKTHEGPGQGKGVIGQVRQGPTGIPFLQGVRIYQKKIQDQNTGKTKIARNIMTFRVQSSKHQGSGRWVHPGLEARHFFDKAADWALDLWSTRIVPDIMRRLDSTL